MDSATEPLFSDETGFSGPVTVVHVVFASNDGDYAVVEVRDGSGEEFIAIGSLTHLSPGARARMTGEWQEHTRYGRQLRANTAIPLDPTDREGQVAYLSSLRNIGEVRAEALCDLFGEEVLDRIAADPSAAFGSLPKFGKKRVEAAVASWYETRAVRDLHVELGPHGLAHLAGRINARFGDEALRVLREDPYRLTEVDGVGFQRADVIAQGAGVPPESDRRAQAAAWYLLGEAERRGHTHLTAGDLAKKTGDLLGLKPDPEVLLAAPGLIVEGERVYRERTLNREQWVAAELRDRAEAEPQLEVNPRPSVGSELTGEQWRAVEAAFTARISVVTGGPGVGKTVCTRAIVDSAREARLRVGLCAPTGRAARRMAEATGTEAHTIHRLLEWRPGSEPTFRPGHPLPLELLIVDEASMINLHMAEVLLGGVGIDTHIVLVGDADQLPPVGAGKPFSDLLESGLVPATRLTHVFRQAAQSMIITAAHEVNQGRAPHLEPGPDQHRDFHLMERVGGSKVKQAVVQVISERVAAGLGLDPIRDAQVLAPIYRGDAGIDVLNRELQAKLNPDGRKAIRDRFRVGDRVIQTRNAYDLGLMNGTICFLIDDDPDEEMAVLETDDGEQVILPWDDAGDLKLAYAISVHKSQGSEIPVVVFVCHRSHAGMLTRPLIYTAITRAKEMCVLVGDRPALEAGVRRDESGRRNSSLARRLAGELDT
ncbi:MAG: ATP-dependent RecD-like DNA helicase [Solirubrobacterales bacterium]|nr:ATP-dependent RecD-like DNA helicase [Solirubrobacterales bacterium]